MYFWQTRKEKKMHLLAPGPAVLVEVAVGGPVVELFLLFFLNLSSSVCHRFWMDPSTRYTLDG